MPSTAAVLRQMDRMLGLVRGSPPVIRNFVKPREAAARTAAGVCARLSKLGAEIRMKAALRTAFSGIEGICFLPENTVLDGADFVIAIGGDGTILRASGWILDHAVKHSTPPVRLVGINTGTLGFLAAFEA